MHPKISIIIPVYNPGEYFRPSIDSMLAQTFTDFEIILVDDGSSDGSERLCDDYAVMDSRIRVIHKENGGASAARNIGLDNAKGEWICFVDADDTMTPEALARMYGKVTEYDADYISCMMDFGVPGTDTTKVLTDREKDDMTWAALAYRAAKYVKEGFLIDSPCAKLFRHSVIKDNDLRFIAGLTRSEDAIFDAYFYQHCGKVILDSHVVYYYTINPDSACHSLDKRLPDMLARVLEEEKKFVEEYHHGNEYFNTSLYVRAMVALEQVMGEGPTKMLSFMQHVKFTQGYLNTPIVHECLQKLSYNTLNEYFTWRSRTLDLFLAKRKCALLLHIWTDDRWELNLRWERAKGNVREIVKRRIPSVYRVIHGSKK